MGLSRRLFSIFPLLALAVTLHLKPEACRADAVEDASNQLSAAIAARLGARPVVALSFKNISSLPAARTAEFARLLRARLRSSGVQLNAVASGRRGWQVQVTLSENIQGYLLVAEIVHPQTGTTRHIPATQAASDSVETIMVSFPRPDTPTPARKSAAMSIRKVFLLEQDAPILDLSVTAQTGVAGSDRLVVFDPEKVSLYQVEGSQWVLQRSLPVQHLHPLPRDVRGRLVLHPDDRFDAYLPGEACNGAFQPTPVLTCRDSSEPWPLSAAETATEASTTSSGRSSASAIFAPARNFFDGRINNQASEGLQVPPFFTAAILDDTRPLWILSGVDGRVRLLGRGMKLTNISGSSAGLGSDMAALRSGCGAGSEVLAVRSGDFTQPDTVVGLEIVNRQAVPVTPVVEFSGPITALWASSDNKGVTAVSRDLNSGRYDAFLLSVTCSG